MVQEGPDLRHPVFARTKVMSPGWKLDESHSFPISRQCWDFDRDNCFGRELRSASAASLKPTLLPFPVAVLLLCPPWVNPTELLDVEQDDKM